MDRKKKSIGFPYKKLEKLIGIANKYNLLTLKVGAIELEFKPPPPAIANRRDDLSEMKHNGKPLSQRQKEDIRLFGQVIEDE